jgi:hypothetical protein
MGDIMTPPELGQVKTGPPLDSMAGVSGFFSVGRAIVPAAAFQAAFPRPLVLATRRRLKAGCGQDCPPHKKNGAGFT